MKVTLTKKCTVCKGKGSAEYQNTTLNTDVDQYGWPVGLLYPTIEERDCSNCRGTGQVSKDVELKEGAIINLDL